jgi:UDP-N-acetylmuramoyl-tripeptide--D-alanyl-D-alanine ligase
MKTIQELYERFLSSAGVFTDTRQVLPNGIFFALKGENFDGNQYALQALENGAAIAVVDDTRLPANPNLFLVQDVLKALQDLAHHHRKTLGTPIVALTGSNGKTTTKELMHAVLSRKYNTLSTIGNFNNHIGVPLTLLQINATHQIAIIEMGANHQREIATLCEIAAPDYGLITNYGLAHLEGFGGKEGIVKGKSEMFDYLRANNRKAFVRAEDHKQMEKTHAQDRVLYGLAGAVSIEELEGEPYAAIRAMNRKITSRLVGDYNAKNMTIAAAVGFYFEVPLDAIADALEQYQPNMNRSQKVETGQNVVIMDAYNANPSSMEEALRNLSRVEGEQVAILGDMFELGEETQYYHKEIVKLARQIIKGQLFFVGQHFFEASDTQPYFFKSASELKEHLIQNPLSSKTILLKGSRGMKLEALKDLF